MHQTRFAQVGDRFCFSRRKLPVCSEGCKESNRKEVTVSAHCRPVNEPAAKHYASQIKAGKDVPNMQKQQASEEVKYMVPTECVRAA